MKTLLARPVKNIDQRALAEYPGAIQYVPLYDRSTWTEWQSTPAQNYVAVYQCVRVLSNFFAQLPLKVYRKAGDGSREEARDHPLYRVLHLQPNPDTTSFVWRKAAMRDLAMWGNHYSERVYDQLGRLQLWRIRPDVMDVRWDENGRRSYWYRGQGGTWKRIANNQIFHMQGQSTDGLRGFSPLAELRMTLDLAGQAEGFASSTFRNGARPAVVLSHPKTLSKPAQERLAVQMDEIRGSQNAGKTVVLEEGLQVTPIGFPPEDSQFLEARLNQHRFIYGAYGIPPHKVGDLERATFSNIEHQALEFVQDGGLPWLVNAEQEFSTQLISEGEEDVIFAEFDVDGYLRGDSKSRAEAFAIRWQHGTLTPDQWRAKENENPLPDGIGDKTYVPVNYSPVLAPEEAPATTTSPEEPTPLFAAKSAEVRCPKGHLLAEMATPPYRFTCPKCKAVAAKSADEPADPMKSVTDRLDDLPERLAALMPKAEPPSPPEVHFHEGAFKAGDVHVPPTVIEPGAVQVHVAAPPAAKAPVVNVTLPEQKPIRRTVERDADNKIVAFQDAS